MSYSEPNPKWRISYKTDKEMAKQWHMSRRRVIEFCIDEKINDIISVDWWAYRIADDLPKPMPQRTYLRQIDAKQRELAAIDPPDKFVVQWMENELIADFIYHANRICGSLLTFDDTVNVLNGAEVNAGFPEDVDAVLRQRDALLYLRSAARNGETLSHELIKHVHYLLMNGKYESAGDYRTRRVGLEIGDLTIQPYKEITKKIRKLISENARSCKKNMPTAMRMARLYLTLLDITPFYDGNRRVALLLVNFELMRAGFPMIFLRFCDSARVFRATETFIEQGSFEHMAELMAMAIDRSLDIYLPVYKKVDENRKAPRRQLYKRTKRKIQSR